MSTAGAMISLNVNRETAENSVLPWLFEYIGTKRGKKRDWHLEHPSTKINKKWLKKLPYSCRVYFKHIHDAVRFAVEWNEVVSNVSFTNGYRLVGDGQAKVVRGSWKKILPMLQWMQRNLKSSEWTITGPWTDDDSHMIWYFNLKTIDAKMAFELLKPASRY